MISFQIGIDTYGDTVHMLTTQSITITNVLMRKGQYDKIYRIKESVYLMDLYEESLSSPTSAAEPHIETSIST